MHITLSLAPGENLPKDKLMEMSQACAKEMGFENNQYVAVLHRDTNHQHIHIVANRVGFDKRTVSDSNSYRKIAEYCRRMELLYGLQRVLSPRQFLSKDQRTLPRLDRRKEQLRQHIQQALVGSRHFQEFEQKMKEKGYQVIKGRGISFIDDKKVKVKGSELNYSLQTIEWILEKQKMLGMSQSTGVLSFSNSYTANQQSSSEAENKLSEAVQGINLQKGLPAMIEQILKPENPTDPSNSESVNQRKRKRKIKRSHHW